jgi:hypothetical protein
VRAIVLALLLSGCALHHTRDRDAGPSSDSAIDAIDAIGADAAAAPDAPPPIDAGPLVRCGPNTCRSGEICCNETCGVCAFPAECEPIGCP